MDILRPGHSLGPVASRQTQAHAPTGEAGGGGEGEGGVEGGGAAPAGEGGGEEQEFHGGEEGEDEGEEEEEDDDVELEEHELAKAPPRARRGGDSWPNLPTSPPGASRGGDSRGGGLAHNPTHADSRRAPPTHRASKPVRT